MTKFLDIIAIAIVGALVVALLGYVYARFMSKRPLRSGPLSRLGTDEDDGDRPRRFLSSGLSVALLGACAAIYITTLSRFETVRSNQVVRESSSLATAADLAQQFNEALSRIEARKDLGSEDAERRKKLVEELRSQAEAARVLATTHVELSNHER